MIVYDYMIVCMKLCGIPWTATPDHRDKLKGHEAY